MVTCYYFTTRWWMYLSFPVLALSVCMALVYLKKNRHRPLPFISVLPLSHHQPTTVRGASHAGGLVFTKMTTSPYPYFLPVFYLQGVQVCGVFIPYARLIAIFLTFTFILFLVRTVYCVQQQQVLVAVLQDTMNKVSSMPSYPAHLYQDRGIIMCGGGKEQLAMIYANIYTLREVLKCDLPIEVFHIGQGEITQRQKTLIEGKFAKVKVRDVFSFDVDENWRQLFISGGKEGNKNAFNLDDGRVGLKRILSRSKFAVKPFSLLFSSFKEAIIMDHDTIPVQNPALLFEDLGYLEKGNIFWKDVDMNKPSAEFFQAMHTIAAQAGESRSSEDFWFEETETGQWMVNKQRCWAGIYATWLLLSRAEVTMQYMHGDKDAFFFGFLLAQFAHKGSSVSGTFYHMPHTISFAGFYDREKASMSFTAFVHSDSQEQPLFFHHTGELGKRAINRLAEDPLDRKHILTADVLDRDAESTSDDSQSVGEKGERVLWTHLLKWTKHSQSLAYEKRRVYPLDPKNDHTTEIPNDVQTIGTRFVNAMEQFYAPR